MFTIVGNLNFLFYLTEFKDFLASLQTVVDSSLGNYNFAKFDAIDRTDLTMIGIVYMILILVTFFIILINLLIAMLANTFKIFDDRSNGLYLSKIL
jgi:hypothetical protein